MRYEKSSRLTPDEIQALAHDYFVVELGLHEVRGPDGTTTFTGGGGGVSVSTQLAGRSTKVEILAREWDFQAQEFLRRIRR